MAENEFKEGDVVQLKSGGPKMTIAWIGEQYGETQVSCMWFDGPKRMSEVFRPAVLKSVID